MAAFGFTEADYSPEQRQSLHDESVFNVWPDNWLSVSVFDAMGTQWNVGPGGPVGLRYEALREVRSHFRVTAARWPAVFDDLRLMEAVALEQMQQTEGQPNGS